MAYARQPGEWVDRWVVALSNGAVTEGAVSTLLGVDERRNLGLVSRGGGSSGGEDGVESVHWSG